MCSNAERAGLCGSPGTATALHRWLTRATPDLHEKIVEIAHVGRRFGCRRVHDLFRPQFSSVNHKRVYRLCRQANLAVRRLKYVKVADDFSHESVNGKIREEHLNGCWFQTLHQARTALAVWRTDYNEGAGRTSMGLAEGGRSAEAVGWHGVRKRFW